MKKLILIFSIGITITILIYNYTVNKKMDVFVIGDSVASGDTLYGNSGISYNLFLKQYLKTKNLGNYDETYVKNNMTIRDFNYQFIENIEINERHLQNRVREAEIIIISLGQDELVNNSRINNLKKRERKQFYEEYKKLLSNLRSINSKEIIIIGFFGNKINQLAEIENNIINISNSFNIKYLKINQNILQSDYFDNNYIHLNYKGHKKIFESLKEQNI